MLLQKELCLKNIDNCQHTISELRSAVTGLNSSNNMETVIIANDERKDMTICFIDTEINIFNALYENKKKNATEE
ncbi:hypothetical protein PR048_031467 [Dryococelus australis]|uniref:Uncharacterized protein n=1 Tax=Dryococelus australis TaxID=614101 RepID=A0ABQ9G5D5_9NEOP|nr:hypothetical protein PR048_031467 [Dryococelus australis]